MPSLRVLQEGRLWGTEGECRLIVVWCTNFSDEVNRTDVEKQSGSVLEMLAVLLLRWNYVSHRLATAW